MTNDPAVTSDLIRLLVMAMGGFSFGAATLVMRELAQRVDRHDQLAVHLFAVVHILVVVYVSSTLLEYWREPLTWRAPLAGMIFTLKSTLLLFIHSSLRTRDLRDDPPARRAEDAAPQS